MKVFVFLYFYIFYISLLGFLLISNFFFSNDKHISFLHVFFIKIKIKIIKNSRNKLLSSLIKGTKNIKINVKLFENKKKTKLRKAISKIKDENFH